MIDYSKFDFIEDLPVSEEMIGAYLEGKLAGSEMRDIQNLISEDLLMSNLIDEVEIDNPLDLNFASGLSLTNNVEYGLNDANTPFELPSLETQFSEDHISETIVTEVISSTGGSMDCSLYDSQEQEPYSSSPDSMSSLD